MFKVLTGFALLLSATAAPAVTTPSSISLNKLERLREMARGICPNSDALDPQDFYDAGRQGGWSKSDMDLVMGYCALYLKGRGDGLREAANREMIEGRRH